MRRLSFIRDDGFVSKCFRNFFFWHWTCAVLSIVSVESCLCNAAEMYETLLLHHIPDKYPLYLFC